MAFVRVKRISGKEYGYLVTNSWTGSGPRQKVAGYLGRIIRPEKAKSEGLGAFLGLTGDNAVREWVVKRSFAEIASALMKLELANHGITEGNGLKINAENGEFTDGKGKKTVFALNDGFLCNYTAKKLLEYDAAVDYSGYNLADALTAAGIAAEKDVFISIFGKMQAVPKKAQEIDKKVAEDFYY